MRSVVGPTDSVVIVGAGLSGLAAAMHLAAAGRDVTVLERASVPGGRAGVLDVTTDAGTYRFDTGPTVLTMPDVIARAFESLGERLDDWLTLERLDPAYRAFYPDGSTLDVRADPDAMAAEIDAAIGPGEAAGFLRYVDFVTELYRSEMSAFIDRNMGSPLGLLTPDLARIVAAGGFRRLADKVGDYFRDARTRRLFSFQSLYAGVSPFDSLAIYAVISYMDTIAGVYFPRGGLHSVPVAMAQAAEKHGVRIDYDTDVLRVETRGRRAVAVHARGGERHRADAVVLTPDLPIAYRDLLGWTPRPVKRLRYSPSCFLMLAGSTRSYTRIAHHNIHFGHAWTSVFDDVIRDGRLMRDPSLLVSNPSRSDPLLAPPSRESYYVLAPTPNLRSPIDWGQQRDAYRDEILQTLERRGYRDLAGSIEVADVTTPLDWAERGMALGTPFAAAHTFAQTGPFRPGNRWGENVVFAGSGTHPGVGIPTVLISGRLAAERITGP